MARTKRRTNRDLIIQYCGYVEELDNWDRNRWPGKDDNAVYARRVNDFTSDKRSGVYGIARWWRRQHWTLPLRRDGRREILRCLQIGSWDNHLSTRLGGDLRHGYYW